MRINNSNAIYYKSEQDLQAKYKKLKEVLPMANLKMLDILEDNRFYPPFAINQTIQYRKIDFSLLKSVCQALICMENIWEQYRRGNIVTEDNFDIQFELLSKTDKIDEDFRFCCHLILR